MADTGRRIRRAHAAAGAMVLVLALVGCAGRGADAGAAAREPLPQPTTTASMSTATPSATAPPALGAPSAPPSVTEPPTPVETAEAPEPTPTAYPPVLELLPRDDGTGTPIHDAATDVDGLVVPESFSESEAANARIWLAQQHLIGQCMLEKGFDYTFTLWWERSPDSPLGSLYPAGTPGWTALYGEQTGEPYDWTTAGCTGYAVHVTGQDDAH